MLDLSKIILLYQYFFLFGLCILKYNFVNNLEKDSYSNKLHTLQLSQMTKLFKFIIFLQVFFAAHSVWFFSEWQISTYCTRLFLCCMYMYKGRTDGWIVVSVPIPGQDGDRPGKGGIRHSHLWQSPGKFTRKVSIILCTYTAGYCLSLATECFIKVWYLMDIFFFSTN